MTAIAVQENSVGTRRPVGQVCPLCGGEGTPHAVVQGVCVRECCGCLLSWAWKDESEYHTFYTDANQFHGQQQVQEGHPTTTDRDEEHLWASRSRVSLLSGMYGLPYGTHILDVGAGGGSFVAACKEFLWEAFGVEPCPALARWAREKGRRVECGGWQNIHTDEWDVICLHDVLEHLTNPTSCLSYLRAHLSQEGLGLIVVEMPEWDSPQARREGLHWRHVLPAQHVCLYSRLAAEELFARCGLRVEAMVRPLRGTLGKISYYLGRA